MCLFSFTNFLVTLNLLFHGHHLHWFQKLSNLNYHVANYEQGLTPNFDDSLVVWVPQSNCRSLIPRPSLAPVFDNLQYAKMEGEGYHVIHTTDNITCHHPSMDTHTMW